MLCISKIKQLLVTPLIKILENLKKNETSHRRMNGEEEKS